MMNLLRISPIPNLTVDDTQFFPYAIIPCTVAFLVCMYERLMIQNALRRVSLYVAI